MEASLVLVKASFTRREALLGIQAGVAMEVNTELACSLGKSLLLATYVQDSWISFNSRRLTQIAFSSMAIVGISDS